MDQAQRYHVLTAQMPIQALTSEWSLGQNRPIRAQHVEDLCKIFKQGGLKRNSKENHILVLCSREDVGNMLQHVECEEAAETTGGMPNFAEWLIVNEGRRVEILAGQHRVEALKRYAEQTGAGDRELWWPCDFYDRGTWRSAGLTLV